MTARSDRRRSDILAFVDAFSALHGYPPTVREIGQAVGLASTSAVQHHLAELRRDGLLDSTPGLSRTLRITPAGTRAILEAVA